MSEQPLGDPVPAPVAEDLNHHPLCPRWKDEPCQCELIDMAYSARAEARHCEHAHCIVEARFCQPHAEEFYLASIATETPPS